MSRAMPGRIAAVGGVLALAMATTTPAQAATNVGGGSIDPSLTKLTLLNINDYHGHFTKDFACTVTTAQRENPGATFVAAGDNIGGTPFESASQNDEPAIDFLNSLDLQASSVGNHEFDKGFSDLTGRVADRASWTYLGANVYRKGTQTPALPEYTIVEQNGVKIGVVGAVTKDVPSLVAADGISGLDFGDPSTAVNRVADQLTDGNAGNGEADVVVAAYHEGSPVGGEGATLQEGVAGSDEFGKIVNNTSTKVAAIITGHTHMDYTWDGPVPGDGTRPVIQTGYYANNLGELTLGYDPETKKVTQYQMGLRPVTEPTAACEADPRYRASAQIVDSANKKAAEIGARQIGEQTGDITTAFSPDGQRDDRMRESTLSNMIAQSYLESINKPGRPGGVDIGVMNPGGVRSDLINDDGKITYADAASIMPFNNTVVTKELTGAQFLKVLEQQWQPAGSSRPFLKLGLSENVTYTYDPTAAEGSRVTTVMVDGEELDPAKTYTVASNSFLLGGGDNFTAFGEGTNTRDSGLIDQSLFVEWIRENSPLSPSFKKGAVAVQDQPTQVAAGEEVSFTVSGTDLTSVGSPTNTTLTAKLGDASLGEFPITAGKSTAPPYPTRDGSADVTVTIPAGTPSGPAMLTLTAAPSGTTVQIPVEVTGGGAEPTPTDPGEPTDPGQPGEPTVTGPPVETGRTGAAGLGNTGTAGAGAALVSLLGGAYLVLRRRITE